MKNILILLGLFVFLVIEKASGVPFFDPFADATANGGTSYATGANLIGQSNKTLFTAWYSRGSTTGSSVQPTNVAGNLSYAGFAIVHGQQCCLRRSRRPGRLPGSQCGSRTHGHGLRLISPEGYGYYGGADFRRE